MLFMSLVLYFYTVKDTYLNTMKILYMHNTEILTCNWLGADIEEKSPAPKCPFLFWIMQTYIKTGNLINSSYSVIQVSLSNCKDVRFILIFFFAENETWSSWSEQLHSALGDHTYLLKNWIKWKHWTKVASQTLLRETNC